MMRALLESLMKFGTSLGTRVLRDFHCLLCVRLPRSAAGIDKKRRNKRQQMSSWEFFRESSGLQSRDLHGLSNVESVDSQRVDELIEEGNAFEAGIVSGVEDSGARDGKEVRTREVPERRRA